MARQYLSIDIGGTMIKSARIDHSGNIIIRDRIVTPHTRDGFIEAVTKIVLTAWSRVDAVCISVPGVVNPQTGWVKFTGALAFLADFHLAQHLHEQSRLPVYVGNDANCATLAEMWLGNLRDVENGAVITLGTSVGGGIVINKQLIHGPHFQAGELSAMMIDHDAAELHYSTLGATTSAVQMIKAIADVCDLPDESDGRRAFAEIQAGNPLARSIFEAFCRRVAVLVLNVQTIVDLQRVLIGGGISAQPILIKEIKHQFKKLQAGDRRLNDDVTMPEIMPAAFGNEANLLGALYGYLAQY